MTVDITRDSETSYIDESWMTLLARRKREIKGSDGRYAAQTLVAVFGSSTDRPGSRRYRIAFDLGRELARMGYGIINGGYWGIMEASAAGVKSLGGVAVGVTCGNLPEAQANDHITDNWMVNRWDQRLLALVWLADGYIFLPGSSGTLVELSLVIETQSKGFIPPRPAICLGNYWKSVVRRIDTSRAVVLFAETPAECALMLST